MTERCRYSLLFIGRRIANVKVILSSLAIASQTHLAIPWID